MQNSCFLFGHSDTPNSIIPLLEQAIESEISIGTSVFYVGNRGNFDRLAAYALRAVKQRHREITLLLVLAYHPTARTTELPFDFDETFYPPLEHTPHRYAILGANQYMIRTVGSVICYARHYGNSYNLLKTALHQKNTRPLRIINLSE